MDKMDQHTFTHWYSVGELGTDKRHRFLILFKDGVYIAVDLMMIYFGKSGWVRPSTWREYDDLNVAVTTTVIRGAGL